MVKFGQFEIIKFLKIPVVQFCEACDNRNTFIGIYSYIKSINSENEDY